ncbi:MAG: hypothetical protein KAR54_02980 [Candidatus Pacebacteria bacterium]|nr:hypothetical protein [Candidatus Paceibacterota bacterium]
MKTITKKRLNITLPKDMENFLYEISKRDKIPMATKATSLLELALDIEEDYLLNKLAKKRDKKTSKEILFEKVKWN